MSAGALLAGLAACTAPGDVLVPPERPEVDLADPAAWEPAEGDDPLVDHRPADAACPRGSILVEGLTLEVDTGTCRYAFLEQPTAGDLRPGDRLEVSFWHGELVAEAPGEGHIALLVGGEVLWERFRPVPSAPCAITDVVPVSETAEAGAPLRLHLHNHGPNTWNLFRVRRRPGSVPETWGAACDE